MSMKVTAIGCQLFGSQLLRQQPCTGVLPVMQRALGHHALEPLKRRFGCGVELQVVIPSAIGLQADHIGAVERVIEAPLVAGAEVAA